MKHSLKYPAKLLKKFDISPFEKSGFIKLFIFLSWIFFVLTCTGAEFAPDNFSVSRSHSEYYSNFTEELSPVELSNIFDFKFHRSEIGTVSSFNVILLPHEPSYIDRERGPPFH